MAGKNKMPPPAEEQSAALAALKARILDGLGKVTGNIPGSAEWMAELERRVDNAVHDGGFVLALKQELMAVIPLIQGGKGPVSADPVDLS